MMFFNQVDLFAHTDKRASLRPRGITEKEEACGFLQAGITSRLWLVVQGPQGDLRRRMAVRCTCTEGWAAHLGWLLRWAED